MEFGIAMTLALRRCQYVSCTGLASFPTIAGTSTSTWNDATMTTTRPTETISPSLDAVAPDALIAVASDWLERFAALLETGDPAAVARMFAADPWWRDLTALGWDLRTRHGADAIAELVAAAQHAGACGFRLDDEQPPLLADAPSARLELAFRFETAVTRGRGVAHLVPGATGGEPWRAQTVLTAAHELIGREERIGRRRPYGTRRGAFDSPAPTWVERRAREAAFSDREPEVVVIGAGHSGLGLAARLGRIGVDALVLDRNAAVGDNWRHRYASLVLHDPVWKNHLPYLPFPESWPVYIPKDLLADWLEAYARFLELNVWTSTRISHCTYDGARGRWAVEVERDGASRMLQPAHLVFATGITGTEPRVPRIPGRERFRGRVLHTSEYTDGAAFAGGSVLVVGTGTSGHDIAQDLHEHGARVTLVQRSSTCVVDVSTSYVAEDDRPAARESGPPGAARDHADLVAASHPYRATEDERRAHWERRAQEEADLIARLEASGFATDRGFRGLGPDGSFFERGGGYYLNVGASDLIVRGSIAVRSGIALDRFDPEGAVFDDGSRIDVDAVVLATGYRLIGDTLRDVLGAEAADRCGPVWGIDDEGELRGMWRPTGHPGLWVTGGNLAMSRFHSRHLAIQIAARLDGLVGTAGERSTR